MRWQRAVVFGALYSACTHAPQTLTTIQMDYTRADGIFSAPFPNEDLRRADEHIDLSGFPSQGKVGMVDAALTQISHDARGFSTTAGIFFAATAPIERRSLPKDAAASLKQNASVYLLDVERGERVPVDVDLLDNGGRFGAANLLTLLPYQGVPLRESTLYVAVVTTRVKDVWGRHLGKAEALEALAHGGPLMGLSPRARAEMEAALGQTKNAAAIAVFRTDAPRKAMAAVVQAMKSEHPVPNAPLAAKDKYEDFCVYQSTVDLPQYQAGTPPFSSTGGSWAFDAAGKPLRQRYERARIIVTVPRATMPEGGYPTVVFSRTGAGGDRPLVDHGAAGPDGRVAKGTGPALEFARAGFAAVSIDGPLGGLRNPEGRDEQFLIFNLDNPAAIRDNIRQSAAELVLTTDILERLEIDANACTGNAHARFDTSKLALFGHSMGATIAPLALAFEPRFKAAILSGSGGSFIENVLHKQKPLHILPLAQLAFGYTIRFFNMTQGDPALSMVQWALEPADPPVYGGLMHGNVLMFQGIVDHYILPPMANASSLSMGLDLAGDELEKTDPELHDYAPFSAVAGFSGRGVRPYPVEANVKRDDGSATTSAVVQRAGDGIQDGHEIVFQTAGPKYQYRCFLSTFAASGTPRIVAPQDSNAVCGTEVRAGK